MFTAVIFDLGGVVLESPLEAFRRYEVREGLESGAITRAILATGHHGAWARLERGESDLEEFYGEMDAAAASLGAAFSARRLMAELSSGIGVRPEMLSAVRDLKTRGYRVAALTNIWKDEGAMDARLDRLKPEFDVFIESCLVGMRKPEPAIYRLVLSQLGVEPSQAVFLDDMGPNLKPAQAMGMTTIKVGAPRQALAQLSRLLP